MSEPLRPAPPRPSLRQTTYRLVAVRAVAGALLGLPLRALVWVYRTFVSPVLPPACRYYPSCSQYAAEALRVHGPLRGSWLSVRRLLRCHPFCEGGVDLVPPATKHPSGLLPLPAKAAPAHPALRRDRSPRAPASRGHR